MEKTFKTFHELLEFDFCNLEPQKSNYLKIIPDDGILPAVNTKKWRIINHPNRLKPQIVFEITPLWITITIHETKVSKREDFRLREKIPKDLIQEIFEQ